MFDTGLGNAKPFGPNSGRLLNPVFEGYFTDKWIGSRLRRTIRLHRELFAAQGPMEIRDLVTRYHRAYPADPCSVRDAIIVMCLAPHLFAELQDSVWTTVGEPPPAETVAVDWKK